MVYFAYIYHENPPNVGKYTSPMDPMGAIYSVKLKIYFDSNLYRL